MSKYKKGDKVVIRKDLVDGEYYGDWSWCDDKNFLKEKDYLVINCINQDGDYWVEGEWLITEEMIEGLYVENVVNIKPNYEDKYSDPTLFEIITDFLNRLENAYDNKKFIPITTTDLLVLQRLLNDAGFNYKFKEISKINTK